MPWCLCGLKGQNPKVCPKPWRDFNCGKSGHLEKAPNGENAQNDAGANGGQQPSCSGQEEASVDAIHVPQTARKK